MKMIDKVTKKKLKRLTELDCPIPDGCEETVNFLLDLEVDVFWDVCKAVLDGMDKIKSKRLLEIIAEMLEGYPKELEDFRAIEAQFEEYFDEMDKAVSLTGLLDELEEIDEP